MSWYKITAMGGNRGAIEIEGEIGWEVSARQFRRDLRALGDVSELDVTLNSPGGSVWDGVAIFNSLRDHSATVNIRIIGLAASMGSVISQSADNLQMADSALMMIHNPSVMAWGTAEDLRKSAVMLDKHKEAVMKAYQVRGALKLSEEELSEAMDEETWYTADEARDIGFVDEVEPTEPAAARAAFSAVASFDFTRYSNAPSALKRKITTLRRNSADHEPESRVKPNNNTPPVSSADESQEDAMSGFSKAELDAAVNAAVEEALKGAEAEKAPAADAETPESAAQRGANDVHTRYEALMAHSNAGNTAAVAKLARSSMALEDALSFMDDVASGVAAAEKSPEPASKEALMKVATEAAAAAVARTRAGASDTRAVGAGSAEDEADDDEVQAAVNAANKRRGGGEVK